MVNKLDYNVSNRTADHQPNYEFQPEWKVFHCPPSVPTVRNATIRAERAQRRARRWCGEKSGGVKLGVRGGVCEALPF